MEYKFKNLVFEGGGVKGIAYGGALDILNQKKIIDGIERVGGTSAGAINATMMSLGATTDQISDLIASTDFGDFADHNSLLIRNSIRLIKRFGWNKGDAFKSWMSEQVKSQSGKANLTFAELEEEIKGPNPKGYKSLYMIATNLSKQKFDIFSTEHTPNVMISDAVRMSMSIPLYFAAFKYKAQVMVDGGVSYNYPINLFDDLKYVSNPENQIESQGKFFNTETLGLRLDSKEVIDFASRNWASPPEPITSFKSYLGALVNYLTEMANKGHLLPIDWNRTIFIDTLDVKTTDFGLPQERIDALIKSGSSCTSKYFDWRDSDSVWKKTPN